MKIRTGFVSNSSSSSFIVLKKNLRPKDERIIRGMIQKQGSGWKLFEEDDRLIGYTDIENYGLEDKLHNQKVDVHAIAWMDRPGWAWREIFLGEKIDVEEYRENRKDIKTIIGNKNK